MPAHTLLQNLIKVCFKLIERTSLGRNINSAFKIYFIYEDDQGV